MRTALARFVLAAVLLGAAGIPAASAQEVASFTFTPDSRIRVTGTSTVHDWTCEAETLAGTLAAVPQGSALSGVRRAEVTVPVSELACGNGTMDRKLRDAFDARAHPVIRFTLTDADVAPAAGAAFTVRATGRLTMAGSERAVTFDARGAALGDGGYRFTGAVPLEMSAFGMSPPTAMLGTLKTGDAVVVHFDVVARR